MGGSGSGRYGYRPVVENGLKLDSYRLQRQGIMKIHRSGCSFGSIEWTYTSSGEHVASISFSVNYDSQNITLRYTNTVGGEKYSVNDNVQLTTQKTNFGGSRFLFICPGCYTIVAKLYLPSGAIYFRCRRCYNLTYRSCKESGRFNHLFRQIAFEAGVSFAQVKNILKKKW